jgi:hypothetical protein
VRRGQGVTFNGSGGTQLSADPAHIATVAGSRAGRKSPNAPIPGVLAGALIGRVGGGQPLATGDQKTTLTMPAMAHLDVGINGDHCDDIRGQFRVQSAVSR